MWTEPLLRLVPCRQRQMYQLLQDMTDGYKTTQIIWENPSFDFKSKEIDTMRTLFRSGQYREENRDI